MSGNPVPVRAISTAGEASVLSLGSDGGGAGKIMSPAEMRNAASVYSQSQADSAFVALSGAYSDPAWITALSSSKITGLSASLTAKADLVGGFVPSNQLPSYVDDVVEVANFAALPVTGETGKIYVAVDTLSTYRWSGSVYVALSSATAVWGSISGTVANQTDLTTYLSSNYSAAGHSHAFSSLSGIPTTLSGYGITDAYPLASNPGTNTTAGVFSANTWDYTSSLTGDPSDKQTNHFTFATGSRPIVSSVTVTGSPLDTINYAGHVFTGGECLAFKDDGNSGSSLPSNIERCINYYVIASSVVAGVSFKVSTTADRKSVV